MTDLKILQYIQLDLYKIILEGQISLTINLCQNPKSIRDVETGLNYADLFRYMFFFFLLVYD